MTRRPILALPFALALWPAAAPAQEGPSFDCRDASTRTEAAICASPELARLEMRMFRSFQLLEEAVGRREARRIADELLLRRQACEGDPNCIAERLLISMEVFEQRAGRDRVAELVPSVPLPDRDGQINELVPVVPEPEADVAALDEPETFDPEIPLAAQAPLPDLVPIPPSRDPADAELTAEELGEVIDGAELASSDGGDPAAEAAFDTPLSWAFMDLEREERAAIQARLAGAGFYDGEAAGTWTNGTLAALRDFAAEEGSDSFDLSAQEGAALLLDYIGSDAFAASFGTEEEAAAAPPVPLAPADPIQGTDW